MPTLELYDLPGCPYCAKVKRALDDLGLEYGTHTVSSARSARDEVYAVSGQYGVPVLVDAANGIDGMAESDDIVRYLYETYGDGAVPDRGLVARLRGLLG
jgi:glutathione S-transferase